MSVPPTPARIHVAECALPPEDWRGENLIFIVGCSRSGTTWLQQMLGAHPAIVTAQESHIFSHVLGPLYKKWDQLLSVDLGRKIGLPAYLTEPQLDELSRLLVHQVLSKVEGYSPGGLFVEKTPDHVLFASVIDRVFPRARFVNLLRNPQDVVESLLDARRTWGRNWAPRSALTAAYLWRRAVRAADEQLGALAPSRRHQLRYESMREDPASEVKRVLNFLAIEQSAEILAQVLEGMGPLPLYGHFARSEGHKHQEPGDFRRTEKSALSWPRRLLVHLACQPYKHRHGY